MHACALRDHAFLRGVIIKRTKKIAEIYSDLWEDEIQFTAIPKTTIKFDPDRLAPFVEDEGVLYDECSTELKVAKLYIQNWSITKIAKELKLHPEQVRRMFKKVLKAYLSKEQLRIEGTPEKPLHTKSLQN